MANVIINDTNLTNIANAIREKNGLTDTYKPSEMATAILAIQGGGTTEVEPIVLTGDCTYACAGVLAGAYIDSFGYTISTNDLYSIENMFYENLCKNIPFTLNIREGAAVSVGSLFERCKNLKTLPKISSIKPNSMKNCFSGMYSLSEIPNDYFDNWVWSTLQTNKSAVRSYNFYYCFSLRKIPETYLKNAWGKQTSSSFTPYYYNYTSCYALDELNNVGVQKSTLTSNVMSGFGTDLFRVKNITFALNDDGTPQVANWKGQILNLSTGVGYVTSEKGSFETYTMANTSIGSDDRVYTEEQYQALKNTEDWWSPKLEYSRYNHDSAVRTINSLPDCSAYLATAGGTNTIKFKGASGSLTDGGAINTLTEEEIAVATSKGWTVSLV